MAFSIVLFPSFLDVLFWWKMPIHHTEQDTHIKEYLQKLASNSALLYPLCRLCKEVFFELKCFAPFFFLLFSPTVRKRNDGLPGVEVVEPPGRMTDEFNLDDQTVGALDELPTDLSSLSNFDWPGFFLTLAKKALNARLLCPFLLSPFSNLPIIVFHLL